MIAKLSRQESSRQNLKSKVDVGLLAINQAELLQREIKDVTDLHQSYKKEKQLVAEIKMDLVDYEEIDKGLDLLVQAEELMNDVKELSSHEEELYDLSKEIKHIESSINGFANINKIDIIAMETLRDDVNELQYLYKDWYTLDEATADLAAESVHAINKVKEIEAKVSEIFKQLGNKCPTCQQEVSDRAVEEMLQHV
jgi:DNA repair exonuclease SbcCD ATPase subunit